MYIHARSRHLQVAVLGVVVVAAGTRQDSGYELNIIWWADGNWRVNVITHECTHVHARRHTMRTYCTTTMS